MNDDPRGKKRVGPGQTADGPIGHAHRPPTEAQLNEAAAAATLTVVAPRTKFDDLIDDFAPKSDTFTVTVSGKDFKFHAITDRKVLSELVRRAKQFASKDPKTIENEEHREWFDTDSETRIKSFTLAELLVEPKASPFDLLKLAKKAALGFETINAAWAAGQSGADNEAIRGEVRAIDAAKARIKKDVLWRNRLVVARDAFHAHPDQLETGSYEDFMLIDLIALRLIENEEEKVR